MRAAEPRFVLALALLSYRLAFAACSVESLIPSSNESAADPQAHALRLLLAPPSRPAATVSWRWLKVVTGGDTAAVNAAQDVIGNQQAFAERHAYAHEVHSGNYAHPWAAYWHKIDVLLQELRAPHPPRVLAWFDLDLVVTNPGLNMLERILNAHPRVKMILTEDAHLGSPVPGTRHARRLANTGAILVRASAEAERVLERLLAYGRQHRRAAYLPQGADNLHEQDAFNALMSGPKRHLWRRHIAVIPQRSAGLNLNTFARNLYDAHFQDPESAEWAAGDFTAHCTGLRKQLREWCIADSIQAADAAASAADMCHNGTLHEEMEAHAQVGPEAMNMESNDASRMDESLDALRKRGTRLLDGGAIGSPRLQRKSLRSSGGWLRSLF